MTALPSRTHPRESGEGRFDQGDQTAAIIREAG